MAIAIHNFGCRLNLAEGEAIAQATHDLDDLVVINSCAVTAEAARQARQAVRRAARTHPQARIVVTGCSAQIEPEQFAGLPNVVAVLGNQDKRNADRWRALPSSPDGAVQHISPPDAPTDFAPVLSGGRHARAFIEVQTGCDHRCTYCIIPYGRGDARSASRAAIADLVGQALDRGQQEVVLTGVDLSGYDGGVAALARWLLGAFPGLARLRLSSIDPVDLNGDLITLFADAPRLMPHVHLSLQSGHNLILKRMKRRHSREGAIAAVAALKAARPEVAIGADLIAGFPTEDQEMAEANLSIIDACDIVFGHIFPFSPRPGTPAARMPQLPSGTARARAAQLRARVTDRFFTWANTLVGTVQPILIEKSGEGGHAPNFARVRLAGPARPDWAGQIVPLLLTGVGDGWLLAHVPDTDPAEPPMGVPPSVPQQGIMIRNER